MTGAYSGMQGMCTGADRGSQGVQGMRTRANSGLQGKHRGGGDRETQGF